MSNKIKDQQIYKMTLKPHTSESLFQNVQFCPRSRAIPQDSGIGSTEGGPEGRGAWTPRVNAKILTAPMGNPSGQASMH